MNWLEHIAIAKQGTDAAYTSVCTRMALYGGDTFRARFPPARMRAVLVSIIERPVLEKPCLEVLGP